MIPFWTLLIGCGLIFFLGTVFVLVLALVVIVRKAGEPPQQGESTAYRLEQGQEVGEKSPGSKD